MITNTARRSRSRIRSALAGAGLLALLAPACIFGGATAAPPGSPGLDAMARELGADVVERLVRGFHPDRSPDVIMVARPSNVVVRWSGASLGSEVPDLRTTHASPWAYHQRVPIILYGPGFVRAGVRSSRQVDVADLAPTMADLTRASFRAPDGEALSDALLPPGRRNGRPRLIVLVAYDGGGWNLLQAYPDAWPQIRRLAAAGTAFTNATIGSSPSVTAAIHATMGTGAYPRTHGVPEHAVRWPDGSVADVYRGEAADPALLSVPTFADAWDQARANRPWVGLVATEAWHLGMVGKGAVAHGGDRDVAMFWDRDRFRFHTNQEAYSLPADVPPRDALDRRLRELDSSDGAIDGIWLDNDLSNPSVVAGSPAFVRHEQSAVLRLLSSEPIGRDDVTDLLFIEFKSTDLGAHIWNIEGEEEPHVLRAQDDAVAALVQKLDRLVGRDRYVLAVTADHGLTPLPERMGGVRVHPDVVGQAVDEYFDRELVERVTPSGIYLDRDRLRDAGITVTEVARFVAGLTYRDVLPADADEDAIDENVLGERVFAAALPGAFLASLTESRIRAFGEGSYEEGDLTSADHPYADVLS